MCIQIVSILLRLSHRISTTLVLKMPADAMRRILVPVPCGDIAAVQRSPCMSLTGPQF